MTPKAKANELMTIFLMRQTGEQEQCFAEYSALQCAVYFVETIINELDIVLEKGIGNLKLTEKGSFWIKVLEELNDND